MNYKNKKMYRWRREAKALGGLIREAHGVELMFILG